MNKKWATYRIKKQVKKTKKNPLNLNNENSLDMLSKLLTTFKEYEIFRDQLKDLNSSIEHDYEENRTFLNLVGSPNGFIDVAKYICFPSLTYIKTIVSKDGKYYHFCWEMDKNEFQNFYSRDEFKSFSKFLTSELNSSFYKAKSNLNDEYMNLLLIQHTESFKTILSSFDVSMRENGFIDLDLLEMSKEILSNFSKEVNTRHIYLEENELESKQLLVGSLKKKLATEIEYQRKVLLLNESKNSLLEIETK